MAGRMSKSSSQQWAGAHALSGEAGGDVLRSGVRLGGRRVRVVACSLCRSVSRGP